jgi:Fe-S cluster biogenesis protein NfuA|tara:strand:+ start:179 stop:679 length:501 start_codon:yes stop_codon:yes gene_type:complete
MADDTSKSSREKDILTESYRDQIKSLIEKESQRRTEIIHNPEEISKLLSLSLVKLTEKNDENLVPALMARLGPVRSALDGHGGSIVVDSAEIITTNQGEESLKLVLNLDGACISCGAAPGTLKGIQDDLLIDEEINSVCFSASMLEWFNELQREFVLKHGGVKFIH